MDLNKLYLNLPWPLQNILVSLYGIKLYFERYGAGAREFEALLDKTQHFSAIKMADYQEAELVRLLKSAILDVPFYRNWAMENGITSEDIRGRNDLEKFPVLTKGELRENVELFISDRYDKKDLIPLSTSGSTGQPVKIYCDKQARTKHYAFFTRLRSWFGVGRRSRRVTFFGRAIMHGPINQPPFWRFDWPQNNLIMSAYHLSDENLGHYYRKIASFGPEEVIGYPSSIYAVADFVLKNDLAPLAPKLVITTGETLVPYQREVIENAFLAPLVNQYGCTEMAFFASQCDTGVMHFHPEHAIVEIEEQNGSHESSDQKYGEVVATSLINYAMPLIRYKISDNLCLSESSDKCHPGFQTIVFLEGRVDDVIYTKDGRSVGRLSPIFKSDKEIFSSKVVQDNAGDITVYVVLTDNHVDRHRRLLKQALRDRIGDSVKIIVKEVAEIEKEPNGKHRPVVSYFKP
jgi:phenylacetate-CoA ligase